MIQQQRFYWEYLTDTKQPRFVHMFLDGDSQIDFLRDVFNNRDVDPVLYNLLCTHEAALFLADLMDISAAAFYLENFNRKNVVFISFFITGDADVKREYKNICHYLIDTFEAIETNLQKTSENVMDYFIEGTPIAIRVLYTLAYKSLQISRLTYDEDNGSYSYWKEQLHSCIMRNYEKQNFLLLQDETFEELGKFKLNLVDSSVPITKAVDEFIEKNKQH
jgi:hypothetical protein